MRIKHLLCFCLLSAFYAHAEGYEHEVACRELEPGVIRVNHNKFPSMDFDVIGWPLYEWMCRCIEPDEDPHDIQILIYGENISLEKLRKAYADREEAGAVDYRYLSYEKAKAASKKFVADAKRYELDISSRKPALECIDQYFGRK